MGFCVDEWTVKEQAVRRCSWRRRGREARVEHSVDKACPKDICTLPAPSAAGTARTRRPKRQKAGGPRALDLPCGSALREIRGDFM